MEVTVIDDSDFVGWAAAVTRRNEIYMSNTKDMVNNVITHISGNKISRLNILDHGNSHSFQLGQDRNLLVDAAIFVGGSAIMSLIGVSLKDKISAIAKERIAGIYSTQIADEASKHGIVIDAVLGGVYDQTQANYINSVKDRLKNKSKENPVDRGLFGKKYLEDW